MDFSKIKYFVFTGKLRFILGREVDKVAKILVLQLYLFLRKGGLSKYRTFLACHCFENLIFLVLNTAKK
jgi:hypothetical protein